MEWPEFHRDGTRNGEYTGVFYGRIGDNDTGNVARTREYGVLGMGARDYMGCAPMDGDGARDKHGCVFYQWSQLEGVWGECV